MKSNSLYIPVYLFVALCTMFVTFEGKAQVSHDAQNKAIQISTPDRRLSLSIDYARGAKISNLEIKGKNVLASKGAFTSIRTSDEMWSSSGEDGDIKATLKKNQVILDGIKLGDAIESWRFLLNGNDILWTISRTYSKDIRLEDMAMPSWHFVGLETWKGGILDNGGMVWCKYLASVNDTYGVHTAGVTFWNENQEDALRILPKSTTDDHEVASKYSHNGQGSFTFTQYLTDHELKQRYDLSRFVNRREDVFAPFDMKKGTVEFTTCITYVNYLEEYDRGVLPGIDQSAVTELLNTTGRYGVVDNGIVGANGWVTNWKCLHEPFFAQVGLAVNDKNYTDNLSKTLDRERDYAVLEDGRVLSRWHDRDDDHISGTYDYETGYYEAKWGYTVDSQTGYIINMVEQFHQNGDVDWLRSHKETGESALAWLIRRDSNGNGIFEMVNKNVREEKASDWLDVVWASFENAFVNAQMYESLRLWAECEKILGDHEKASYYQSLADRLKKAFNRHVDEGGFWLPEKKQYVYWRDDDGTVRGDNLVTPVNFAAIAYGICDDPERINLILENIEKRTVSENLFHWPLCFDSYKREDVAGGNWPFPTYENGDIFPTWGYLGIRSYVKYDKDIALKYIRNILSQYRKDGLSSQRYSRVDQKGLGSDILAGISTTITALYSDMYGVQPKWNRIGVNPNMISELNGTRFNYTLRDTIYELTLNVDDYQVKTDDFVVRSTGAFGVSKSGQDLIFYPNNTEEVKLVLHGNKKNVDGLYVTQWEDGHYQWETKGNQVRDITIHGLISGSTYQVYVNNKVQEIQVDEEGQLKIKRGSKNSNTYRLKRV